MLLRALRQRLMRMGLSERQFMGFAMVLQGLRHRSQFSDEDLYRKSFDAWGVGVWEGGGGRELRLDAGTRHRSQIGRPPSVLPGGAGSDLSQTIIGFQLMWTTLVMRGC